MISTPSSTHHSVNLSWEMGTVAASATFQLHSGITALIGPSGAGKTSLARLIAGLDTPTKGTISRNDVLLLDIEQKINIAPEKRSIALVTQEPALFPNMTVHQNILSANKLPLQELMALAQTAGIKNLLDRRPATLSGGEARRVAIIRALASKPTLLLLDEPMSGLDPKLRKTLLGLIRNLSIQTETPMLLITHHIEEMLLAADHAILMANGTLQVTGTIEDVIHNPATAIHLGVDDAGSILTATVTGKEQGLLTASIGKQNIYITDDGETVGNALRLRILARDVSLAKTPVTNISILNQLAVKVKDMVTVGQEMHLVLELVTSDQCLNARITHMSATKLALKKGQTVQALVKAIAVKETLPQNS